MLKKSCVPRDRNTGREGKGGKGGGKGERRAREGKRGEEGSVEDRENGGLAI